MHAAFDEVCRLPCAWLSYGCGETPRIGGNLALVHAAATDVEF